MNSEHLKRKLVALLGADGKGYSAELDRRLKRYESRLPFVSRRPQGENRKKEMTQTLRFLPEVEDDAIRGYAWYKKESAGFGEEFARIFYACISDPSRNFLLCRKVYGDIRS